MDLNQGFNNKNDSIFSQNLNNQNGSIFTNSSFGNKRDVPLDALEQYGDMSGNVKDRKAKKFFIFAVPVLVIELILAVVLLTYLFLLPKNYCNISVNDKSAVIFVNGQETDKFRLQEPNGKEMSYFYEVDISILMPGEENYDVTFTISSDKYSVFASTAATKEDSKYHMQIKGGEKTKLLSAMTIKSEKKIKDFHVDIKIIVNKI